MATPNLLIANTVIGKTAILNVTTTVTSIVTNSPSSNELYKINTLIISNVDGTNAADITVDFYRDSAQTHIAKTISVPNDSSFTAIEKNNPIYLEEGDSIRLTASSNGDLEAICSYEVIS
jgi:hypothetical protein